MKKINLIALFISISIIKITGQSIPTDSLYFGQIPPGDSAILFAPEVLTGSGNNISQMAFSPDGAELFYGVSTNNGTTDPIYHTRYDNNSWLEPEKTTLFGEKNTNMQLFSADGSKLYFSVWEADYTSNIYFIERTNEGWSEAQKLPSPINSSQRDFCYSETNDGVAYISSNRPGSSGTDIWKISMNSDSSYQAEKLSSNVNSSNTEMLPCVAPDGSYLIFSSDRPLGNCPQNLLISFNKGNNNWTTPIDMEKSGAKINVPNQHQNCPTLSPDGKYLFFGRHSPNGVEPFTINTYWVSTSFIDDLKELAMPTSIKEYKSSQIRIYPNPTSESIRIKGFNNSLIKYQIIDINGKITKKGTLGSKEINLSGMNNGIYFLQCEIENQLLSEKFIVK